MQAKELLDGLMEEFRKVAATETIVGEPLTIEGATLIPVIRVAVGVGAGSGEGEGMDPNDKAQGKGAGGGGGGGVRVEPAAFIVMRGGEIDIMAAPGRGGPPGRGVRAPARPGREDHVRAEGQERQGREGRRRGEGRRGGAQLGRPAQDPAHEIGPSAPRSARCRGRPDPG